MNPKNSRLEGCKSASYLETRLKRNHKRIENLRRKIYKRNDHKKATLTQLDTSQKVQSKSPSRQLSKSKLGQDTINLSNAVLTYRQSQIEERIGALERETRID